MEDYLNGEDDEDSDIDDTPKLKPKQFAKDDPRLKAIPTEKATAAHDHLIVDKEPVEMDKPQYG